MWSFVAYLLEGSMCCELRDALLHPMVVTSGYFELLLPSYQLKALSPFSSDLWQSTRHFLTEKCCSSDIYILFFSLLFANRRDSYVGKTW